MKGLERVHPIIIKVWERYQHKECIACQKLLEGETFRITCAVPVIDRPEVFVFSPYGHQQCSRKFLDCVYPILIKCCVVQITITDADIANAKKLLTGLTCIKCGRMEYRKKKHGKCGGCKSVLYCSEECQMADWKFHQHECQMLKSLKTPAPAHQKCISKKCTQQPLNHFQSSFKVGNSIEVTVFACSITCLRRAYTRLLKK